MKTTHILFLVGLSLYTVVNQSRWARAEAQWTDDSHLNVRTRTIINYNNGGLTVCFSHNSNSKPVHVVYDTYPVWTPTGPAHGRAEFDMKIFEDRKMFEASDNERPQCNLLDSHYN
jgi:hypothetical protein